MKKDAVSCPVLKGSPSGDGDGDGFASGVVYPHHDL